MPFEPIQAVLVAMVLFVSSVIQGTVGFAAGLFGVPLLLLLARLSLPETIAVLLVAATFQNIQGTWQLRRRIEYEKTWRPILLRLVSLPMGAWVLLLAGAGSSEQVKQAVGVVLIATVAVMAAWRVKPRRQLPAIWEYPAFTLSGFLAGFCGMGGPPMVLWVTSHRWASTRSRGFLFFVFLMGLLPQLVFHVLFFGTEMLWYYLLGLVCLPTILLGTFLGLRTGKKLPRPLLRKITLAVLVIVGISAIVSPLVIEG
ncbi:MAG: sulfite exporter TauE/SafE family protein [Phycisphaeraceae bacterium]|nr:sulfite exporter TauE/SafE family protein [Phycisphaeraceae bacterium]